MHVERLLVDTASVDTADSSSRWNDRELKRTRPLLDEGGTVSDDLLDNAQPAVDLQSREIDKNHLDDATLARDNKQDLQNLRHGCLVKNLDAMVEWHQCLADDIIELALDPGAMRGSLSGRCSDGGDSHFYS